MKKKLPLVLFFAIVLMATLKTEFAHANLFDFQFSRNLSSSTGGATGMAAVMQIGNDYWVSRWASDSIHRYNLNGQLLQSFVVPGLTGIRSFTYGGSFIYAANNTDTIYRINAFTKTLAPPHIKAPASIPQVRWCTYDSSAAGGAGGFWIGNFATDLTQINLSGTVTNTISAATHGLTGMYGAAIDHISTGGPYLWVFDQSPPNSSNFIRINLNTGSTQGVQHDVSQHVSGFTGSLAGGMCISSTVVPGENTLIGLLQSTPENYIVGLELNNPTLQDAEATALKSLAGLTKVPVSQNGPFDFTGTIKNAGAATIDTLTLTIDVILNGNLIWRDSTKEFNLAAGSTQNKNVSGFTPPGKGDYTAIAYVSTGAQTDLITGNDSVTFNFSVTDSTFARDDNNPTGTGYTVSSTEWAYATTLYQLVADDTLSSIWIRLDKPVHGDTTYAVVAATSSLVPSTVIALGTPVIIDSAVHEYLLPIPGGLPLAAGHYAFGCYEVAIGGIELSQSPNYWVSGINHYYVPSSGWSASGIQTARFIRPNFKPSAVTVSVAEFAKETGISLYPNPTSGKLNIHFSTHALQNQQAEVSVFNSRGDVVRGLVCIILNSVRKTSVLWNKAQGVYFVNIAHNGLRHSARVIVTD